MTTAPPLPTIDLDLPGWALRAWRVSDAADLSRHAGRFEVWRNMSDHFPHPYTLDDATVWVTRGHIDFGGDNWAIAHHDQAVGGAGVVQGEGHQRCNAEIGYWLAPEHWGQGVVTRVARALTDHAMANPEITRVFAPIHAHNVASQRVAQKCGFVREGLRPLSVMKAGRAIDVVVWASYRPGLNGLVAPTEPTN